MKPRKESIIQNDLKQKKNWNRKNEGASQNKK
jgi:hypothetical protein